MDDSLKDRVGFRISSDPDLTRVHTRSEPEGARRSPDLPLRLVLASDLGGSVEAGLLRVDPNGFADAMARLAPRLEIEVPNRISETPREVPIDLWFPDLKAFHPEQIVARVPALAGLFQVRSLIESVRTGEADPKAFKNRLEALDIDPAWAARLYAVLTASPAPPPKPAAPAQPARPSATGSSKDDRIDRILGMVSTGQDEPPKPADPDGGLADQLIRAVTGTSGPRVDRAAAGTLVAELDGVLAGQVNEILHHPAFRRLESAWRGLKFLVDRLNFRENILLDVLSASRAQVLDALHEHVLGPAFAEATEPPVSAVVLDLAFDRSLPDLERLAGLAELGASLQAPVLAGVEPAFFGVETAAGLARLPVLAQHLQKSEFVHWNALRGDPSARALVLALPRFLLRYAYGPDLPVKGFLFEERNGAAEAHLWGGAALAVAAALGDGFARTGWAVHAAGRIENLPIAEIDGTHSPLEVLIGNEKRSEFAEAGFVVLGARPDSTTVFIEDAPTVHRPDLYEEAEATAEARLHSTLPCQLLVTRAAHHLIRFQQEVTEALPAAEIEAMLTERLVSWLRTGGQQPDADAVTVEVVDTPGGPGARTVAVRLKPPVTLLGEPLSLVMQLPLP